MPSNSYSTMAEFSIFKEKTSSVKLRIFAIIADMHTACDTIIIFFHEFSARILSKTSATRSEKFAKFSPFG